MSTWEERMAAAAHERAQERYRLERAQAEAEQAEYDRRLEEESRAEFEAGPPNGCRDCYFWGPNVFSTRYLWWHITIDEGDHTCYHECHGGEPVPCAPVAIG